MATLAAAARTYGVDITRPWRDFSQRERQLVLYGCGDEVFDVVWEFSLKKGEGSHRLTTTWPGFINLIEADYLRNLHNKKVTQFASLIEERRCSVCEGRRLKPEVLGYRYGGLSIAELCAQNIAELGHQLSAAQGGAAQIITEIKGKIAVLTASGLGYLSLDRRFDSLSGGEKQRLQLAGLIAENMSGILYVLDAPARGLRFGDTDFIVENCRKLIEQGNTVVLTDPKQRFYERADHLVVLNRGEVAFHGNDFTQESNALPHFPAPERFFSVGGAHLHNLKQIDVAFGYNTVNVVHGISGSGKTSLVFGVLGRSLERGLPVGCETIDGDFSRVIVCDGVKDTRNLDLASHLGVRELLLRRLAKENGLSLKKVTASEIICPDCRGEGELSAHLELVADVSYTCETCSGTGFTSSVLQYEINSMNIAQVLDAPLSELGALLSGAPARPLIDRLVTLGLGHLRLRQKLKEMSLLSQQLLKIAVASPEASLILMDEPAAELSPGEVVSLHTLFGQLLAMGATVVITEHDPLLIESAGHPIELGPAAGPQGGSLMGL